MLQDLIDRNKDWAQAQLKEDTDYFQKLAQGQSPEIMLVGCCDSRFPFEVITNSIPGEIFVHRNIANQVNVEDENIISAVEFAVKALGIKHIVVCGHYECGGIKAGMEPVELPHVNAHIKIVKNLYDEQQSSLAEFSEVDQFRKMVELNVEKQCENIESLGFMQDIHKSNQYPHIHGWVFDLNTGLIKNLEINKYD